MERQKKTWQGYLKKLLRFDFIVERELRINRLNKHQHSTLI